MAFPCLFDPIYSALVGSIVPCCKRGPQLEKLQPPKQASTTTTAENDAPARFGNTATSTKITQAPTKHFGHPLTSACPRPLASHWAPVKCNIK